MSDHSSVSALCSWIDPTLDQLGPEDAIDYGADCSFTAANLLSRVDIFIFAHLSGYCVQMFLFRSITICLMISIGWEVTEFCFSPLLKNFIECWWDQCLYDLILCNGLGMLLGRQAVKYFGLQPFQWRADVAFFVVFARIETDLMWFFFKHIFGIPTKSPIIVVLVVLMHVSMVDFPKQYFKLHAKERWNSETFNLILVPFNVVLLSLVTFKFGWLDKKLFSIQETSKIIFKWLCWLTLVMIGLWKILSRWESHLPQQNVKLKK